MIDLTEFRSVKNPIPIPRGFADWNSAVSYLCTSRPFLGDQHGGWSAAQFRERRANECVESIAALVYDYDRPTPIEELRQRWEGTEGFIISTKSWTPDYPRWRVILPFSRPTSSTEYRRIWNSLLLRAGAVDEACSDPARFWYLPSTANGLPPLREDLVGDILDVDALLALPERGRQNQANSDGADGHSTRALVALDCECGNISRAAQGERHAAILKASIKLKRYVNVNELDESMVVDALLDAAARCGEVDQYGETEIRRWITDGFGYQNEGPKVPLRNAGGNTGESRNPDDPRWTDATESIRDHHEHDSKAPNPFVLLTQEALWAPLEEPRWVIEDVIREASVVEIIAYAGSSKTWMGDDAAMAVASGQQWLRRFPTVQGRAVLIDWENGTYETRRRVHLLASGRGLTPPVLDLDVCVLPPIYLTSPGVERRLIDLATGCRLIVIDTFRAACPGVDENDSKVRTYIDMLRRVAEKTLCAFLILVHAKKSSGTVVDIDPRELARGSSAIVDAPDLCLLLTYQGEGKPGLVQPIKARQGKAIDPFQVELIDRQNEDGGLLVVGSDVQMSGSVAALEKICRVILDLVAKEPGCGKRTLRARSGLRGATVDEAIGYLLEQGRIVNRGDRAVCRYYLPGENV